MQLAFYSERVIDGRHERFCNLGAWCVSPEYRFHGLRLLKAALSQEGYHFTDLSPSGNVVGVNERLSFRFLDTTTALVPNLPWPSWPGRDRISSDPELIERTLSGRDLDALQGSRRHRRRSPSGPDPRRASGATSSSARTGARACRCSRASSTSATRICFGRWPGRFARHLLIHHGALATLAEERIVGYRPRPALLLRSPRRKMFRSASLGPAQIDYLYSELVCVSW